MSHVINLFDGLVIDMDRRIMFLTIKTCTNEIGILFYFKENLEFSLYVKTEVWFSHLSISNYIQAWDLVKALRVAYSNLCIPILNLWIDT